MIHETKLGSVNLIIHYENGVSGLELGVILMENQSGAYCDVTELVNTIWERSEKGWSLKDHFDEWEKQITESLNEKPSFLNKD